MIHHDKELQFATILVFLVGAARGSCSRPTGWGRLLVFLVGAAHGVRVLCYPVRVGDLVAVVGLLVVIVDERLSCLNMSD